MSYTGSKAAVLGYGAVVSIGPLASATGTPTYVAIGEVTSVSVPTAKRAIVMTTNFNSPNNSVEKLGVAVDYGTLTFKCNRVITDAGQQALYTATLNGNGAPYKFEVQLPINTEVGQTTTGDLLTFTAIISEAGGFEISTDAVSQLSFSLDITGVLSVVPGS